MNSNLIGIIGARSFVGAHVISAARQRGLSPVAFSRFAVGRPGWQQMGHEPAQPIDRWVILSPAAVFQGVEPTLNAHGASRIVAVSSTAGFTKDGSNSARDDAMASDIARGESEIERWSHENACSWVILRPTLIYGPGNGNVSEIASMIRKFRFFPLFGAASGKRQPVHAQDVAAACIEALLSQASGKSYNISGAEILTYREMVGCIFKAMGKRPITPPIPLWVFRSAVTLLNRIPRFAGWTTSMAERMNQDLDFDHAEAAADFGFAPRRFLLSQEDLD